MNIPIAPVAAAISAGFRAVKWWKNSTLLCSRCAWERRV